MKLGLDQQLLPLFSILLFHKGCSRVVPLEWGLPLSFCF